MITLNAHCERTINEEWGTRLQNPTYLEMYAGAMVAYEHYDVGGVHFKLPLGLMEELVRQYNENRKTRPLPPLVEHHQDSPPRSIKESVPDELL